jgi:hypothetical protein
MVQAVIDESFVYEYSMQTQHSSYKPLMMETGTVSETWLSPDKTSFYTVAMEAYNHIQYNLGNPAMR